MSVVGSVSQWIANAKQGDESAWTSLHQRYWPQLVQLAHRRMRSAPLRDRDAEDIAQTAFWSVYQSLNQGRVPRLENRHQFLAFLTHVIACKAINEIKKSLRKKRGSGQVESISPVEALVKDDTYSPVEHAVLNDCYQFYLAELPENLRSFAEYHLAGFSNREIAERLQCVTRTVERKLALVRLKWQEFADDSLKTEVNDLFENREAVDDFVS